MARKMTTREILERFERKDIVSMAKELVDVKNGILLSPIGKFMKLWNLLEKEGYPANATLSIASDIVYDYALEQLAKDGSNKDEVSFVSMRVAYLMMASEDDIAVHKLYNWLIKKDELSELKGRIDNSGASFDEIFGNERLLMEMYEQCFYQPKKNA